MPEVLHLQSTAKTGTESYSIWKPLRGPLADWPLALCDAESVNYEADLIAADVVSRTGYTENIQVYYNPKHQWYYLSGQKSTELAIFCQGDTNYVDRKCTSLNLINRSMLRKNRRPALWLPESSERLKRAPEGEH